MTISADELKHMIKEKKVIIIDVREDSEYQEMHIEDSYHIKLGEVTLAKVTEVLVKEGKDKLVVFQCRSGMRSKNAINKLENEADDKDIDIDFEYKNLTGGILACLNNGINIIRN